MKDVRGGEAMHNKWRWKNSQGRSQFGSKGTIKQPVAEDTWGQIGPSVYVQRSERNKIIVVSDNPQPHRCEKLRTCRYLEFHCLSSSADSAQKHYSL